MGARVGVSVGRWEGSPVANEDGLKRCEETVHNVVVGEASLWAPALSPVVDIDGGPPKLKGICVGSGGNMDLHGHNIN